MRSTWHPDHAHARAALEDFLPNAGRHYTRTRNVDEGPSAPGGRRNVSLLSPYLRHRLICEDEVLRMVLAHHGREGAEKFVQEVFWRTYFKGWLEQHPSAWYRWTADLAADLARLDDDRALRERYVAAVAGRTGIDCFDAWAGELVETGYLHNHARMWFASIWIFTLQLPWTLGAGFFYEHLLDGDPASNTLSWRWVAGLHTRGKHYLARPDNIARYTEGRFHPAGQLDTAAAPLEEDDAQRPALEPLAPPDAPAQADGPRGLLLTLEDCRPETLPGVGRPAAIALAPAAEAAFGAAQPARACGPALFSRGAIADAGARAGAHFGAEVTSLEGPEGADPATWLDALESWVARHGLVEVITAWAPVGPTADGLEAAARRLKPRGVRLVRVRRDYDGQAWPHATKGFFGLKKKIPSLLASLG